MKITRAIISLFLVTAGILSICSCDKKEVETTEIELNGFSSEELTYETIEYTFFDWAPPTIEGMSYSDDIVIAKRIEVVEDGWPSKVFKFRVMSSVSECSEQFVGQEILVYVMKTRDDDGLKYNSDSNYPYASKYYMLFLDRVKNPLTDGYVFVSAFYDCVNMSALDQIKKEDFTHDGTVDVPTNGTEFVEAVKAFHGQHKGRTFDRVFPCIEETDTKTVIQKSEIVVSVHIEEILSVNTDERYFNNDTRHVYCKVEKIYKAPDGYEFTEDHIVVELPIGALLLEKGFILTLQPDNENNQEYVLTSKNGIFKLNEESEITKYID